MKRAGTVSFVGALLAAVVLSGRVPFAQPAATVTLDVVAADKDGNPITDLKAEELQLQDEGKKVTVSSITPMTVTEGRTVIVVLDDSGIPANGTPAIQNIADIFLSAAGPSDKVSVRRLHTRDDVTDFNREMAAARIANYHAGVVPFVGAQTPDEMLELVKELGDQLKEPATGRKAIVCIGSPSVCNVEPRTQSSPRQGYPDWVNALTTLAVNHASVYSMIPAKLNLLNGTLVDASGGTTFNASGDFAASAQQVWRELGSYYLVSYTPPESNKDLRKITVRTSRKGAVVRARAIRGK